MRKFLSLVTLLLVGATAIHADDIVVDLSSLFGTENVSPLTTESVDGVTLTFDKGNSQTNPMWHAGSKEVRLYGGTTTNPEGNTMTIACTSNMEKFVLTAGSDCTWAELEASTGSITLDSLHNATWTGSASEVTITVLRGSKATQYRFNGLTVTPGEGSGVVTVNAPRLSVASGTFYSPFELSMSCSTNGASIYYTLDGSQPSASSTLYAEPITISATTTVKAIAILDGVSSDVTAAEYVFASATPVANIAAFNAVENGTTVSFTGTVTALAQYNKSLYVQDATGNMLIFGTLGKTYKNGDVIPAGFGGQRAIYNGEPELAADANTFQDGVAGTPVEPTEIEVSDIGADLFGQLVLLNNVTLGYTTTSDNKKNLATVSDGTNTASAHNGMGFDASKIDYDKTYNVTGIIGSYRKTTDSITTYQLLPLALEEVGGSSGDTTVVVGTQIASIAEYNALDVNTEFTFNGKAVVTYMDANDKRYLYIKDETGSALIYNANGNPEFAQGTVFTPGWTGKKTNYRGLDEIADAAGLELDGTIEVAPVEMTTADVTTANQNVYGVIKNVKLGSVNGRNFTFEDGTVGYNTFNGTVILPSDLTIAYDIEGVVSVYNNAQFAPTKITPADGGTIVVPDVDNIEALYELESGVTATIKSDLVAIYQNGYYLYVKNEETFALVYGRLTNKFENGDIITDAQASWTTYEGLKQLSPVDPTFVSTQRGNEVEPVEMAIEEIGSDMGHTYVLIKNAELVNDSTNYYTINDGSELIMFNKFHITVPEELDGKTFDVKAFVSLYKGVLQLYPVEVAEVVEPGVRGDVNGDNVCDGSDANVVINMILGKTDITAAADINGDGNVDGGDLNAIINIILGK